MRALVTGGAGFIGSHVAVFLASKGCQVTLLDNLSTGSRENAAGFELIEADVRDPSVRALCAEADAVVHLAAYTSAPGSVERPAETYETNLRGLFNVMGARRLVFASSAAVYGNLPGLPKSEDSPTDPTTPYAETKLIGEHLLRDKENAVALRFFNVYGERQRPDSDYAAVIPKWIEAVATGRQPIVYGDGLQTRDFIYVGDVARAVWLALQSDGLAGETLNIASGRSISLLELLENVAKRADAAPMPRFEPERPGDVRFSSADVSKAERLIGFRAQTGITEGIGRTVDCFRGGSR